MPWLLNSLIADGLDRSAQVPENSISGISSFTILASITRSIPFSAWLGMYISLYTCKCPFNSYVVHIYLRASQAWLFFFRGWPGWASRRHAMKSAILWVQDGSMLKPISPGITQANRQTNGSAPPQSIAR